MANCKKCGTELPSASFGELSDYCRECRAQEAPASIHKRRLVDELPQLAQTSVSWPMATTILIAISVSIFGAMVATGISGVSPESEQLLRWGANFGPYTLGGQYWRLITSAFLHGGFLHLGLNMVSLWILGRMVEKLFGPFITSGLYLLTAIGAGLLTLSWDPMRLSVGASGAIFGLDGVLIPVLYYGKLDMPADSVRRALGWVVKIALVNLLYGLRGNIDNMAHLGGLVTGLVAGLFLARTFSSQWEERISQQTRILAVTALALLLILLPVKRAKVYAIEFEQAATALDRKDYNSAILHLQKYTALKPDDAEGHAELGYALQVSDRVKDAVPEYQRALALDPDLPWVALNLANIYYDQQKPAEAVALFKQCIAKVKARAEDYRAYGSALYDLHNYTEAEVALQRALGLDDKNATAHDLLAKVYDALGKPKDAERERQRASELPKSP